jgi:hypothetical protein
VEEVKRVQAWRKAHPGYWKKNSQRVALQDDCLPRDPLLLGLISTLANSTLQEDIAATCRHLINKGGEILRQLSS